MVLREVAGRRVYPVAAARGLLVFVIVYGPAHLVGASAYWAAPQQDEAMALMGYRYFLLEDWHWPVFVSEAVNVPYPKSVAFLDCIPLWALVNKLVATVVPPWEGVSQQAYLGLWHGLAYALQPCLGIACVRALGHRSWFAAGVTALVMLALPTWIFRYGHSALSAHWIELWALYLYLSRKQGPAWLAQLGVSALVTPYHVAMSLPIFIAALVRGRDLRKAAVWLPLGISTVLLLLGFAGYVAREITRAHWGFEVQSANLLGWLIPTRSGIVGDAQWIANVNATPWQYEGYAYLGVGVLLLLALFVPHVRVLRGVIARHPALFAVVLGAGVFALSNHIYAGSHEIASYPIPRSVRWVTEQFRSPGRFVWIPTYVLVLFLLHWAFAWATTRPRQVLVAVAAVLQVVDATAEWGWQRARTAGPLPMLHDHDGWRALVHAHRAVEILPPYSCVFHPDVHALDHASRQIQLLASERALPINGTYSARDKRKCRAEERAWPTLALRPGTLYVLLPPALAVADRFAASGAACGMFAHGRVCSTSTAAIAAAIRRGTLCAPPPPIALRAGEAVRLAERELGGAWSAADAGGRWTQSSVASLLVRVDGEGARLRLHARALLCGTRSSQTVDVLVGDAVVGELRFDAATNEGDQIVAIGRPGEVFAMQLRPHEVHTPAELGCGEDHRPLGVWVSEVQLE